MKRVEPIDQEFCCICLETVCQSENKTITLPYCAKSMHTQKLQLHGGMLITMPCRLDYLHTLISSVYLVLSLSSWESCGQLEPHIAFIPLDRVEVV